VITHAEIFMVSNPLYSEKREQEDLALFFMTLIIAEVAEHLAAVGWLVPALLEKLA